MNSIELPRKIFIFDPFDDKDKLIEFHYNLEVGNLSYQKKTFDLIFLFLNLSRMILLSMHHATQKEKSSKKIPPNFSFLTKKFISSTWELSYSNLSPRQIQMTTTTMRRGKKGGRNTPLKKL
jgi:hypothetical protein